MLAGAAGTINLLGSMVGVVIMLYFVRALHLTPALMGPLFAVGAVSSFAGAALAGSLVRRWGLCRTLVGALVVNTVGTLCIPLAAGPLWLVVALVAAEQLTDAAVTLYAVTTVSLRQAVTPEWLQGRMNATMHVVEGGAQVIGLLLGGVLGGALGLRATLVLGTLGGLLALLWVAHVPVWMPMTGTPAYADLPGQAPCSRHAS